MTGASGQTRAVIRSSRNSNGQGLSQLPASITITVAILSRFPSSPRPTTGASILLRPARDLFHLAPDARLAQRPLASRQHESGPALLEGVPKRIRPPSFPTPSHPPQKFGRLTSNSPDESGPLRLRPMLAQPSRYSSLASLVPASAAGIVPTIGPSPTLALATLSPP